MRRVLLALVTIIAITAARADAVTVRDIIELSKAGLSEDVLLALIEVDRSVFSIDTETLKQLKKGGVSDAVIVAMIRSGRTPPPEPVAPPATDAEPPTREPQVVVIDHRDAPAPQPQPQPFSPWISYPGAYLTGFPGIAAGFPTVARPFLREERVATVINTDQGLVKARVPVPPNCVRAQPVFWGFGGKQRPGSYDPPPTVVCR
jgi:hypothetical protein